MAAWAGAVPLQWAMTAKPSSWPMRIISRMVPGSGGSQLRRPYSPKSTRPESMSFKNVPPCRRTSATRARYSCIPVKPRPMKPP